jgi:hypothetical protein
MATWAAGSPARKLTPGGVIAAGSRLPRKQNANETIFAYGRSTGVCGEPRPASPNRLRLGIMPISRDFRASQKRRVLIHHKSRRFDVASQGATRLKRATFCRENIALDDSLHRHRFGSDLTADMRVFSDGKSSSRSNLTFHFAVDQQLVEEFNRALDRNSVGQSSARSWHDRGSFRNAWRRSGCDCRYGWFGFSN